MSQKKEKRVQEVHQDWIPEVKVATRAAISECTSTVVDCHRAFIELQP